jgi:Cysteine rich repeat
MKYVPRSTRPGLLVWTALVLATLTGPLAAQQPTSAQQSAIRQNCRADFQARCSGVPTGGAAALGCLQQNAASVSEPCRQALSALGGGKSATTQSPPPAPTGSAPPLSMRQEAYVLREACGADYRNYCHDVPFGGGRAMSCLVSHRSALSSGCREALASARQ